MAEPAPIPFLDAPADFQRFWPQWSSALRSMGEGGRFILGPHVKEFEKKAARFLGTRHALGLANGTDALIMALRVAGVGRGDEVLTTPWSFFASSGAICQLGATPRFADIEPLHFTLNPDAAAAALTPKVRAILPVHIYGCPANMTALMRLARGSKIPLIEDAAQSLGAEWGDEKAGAIGDAGAFSFYPTKILGAYGDGGMMVSEKREWIERAARLANHGQRALFRHEEVGANSRLDEAQAALLLAKLPHLEEGIQERRRVAALYNERLADISDITLPQEPNGGKHAYGLYTLRAPREAREALASLFKREGIGYGIYYPKPLHLQPALSFLKIKEGAFPESERAAHEVFSLPIFPGLSIEAIDRVSETLRAIFR